MIEFFYRKPQDSKIKLLYMGGATWKYKSMFDIDIDEDSFCDILVANGVEVFSFDLSNTDYNDVLNKAKTLIKDFKIDYAMGYSFGCIAASECALELDLLGIILLDPFSPPGPIKSIEIGDQFKYQIADIKETLDTKTFIKEHIKDAHIKTLSDTDILLSPTFPKKLVSDGKFSTLPAWTDIKSINCPIYCAFTNTAKDFVKNYYGEYKQKTYGNNTHWILLEDGRFELAKDILEFINSNSEV